MLYVILALITCGIINGVMSLCYDYHAKRYHAKRYRYRHAIMFLSLALCAYLCYIVL